jgi:putative transposase
VLRYIELNPVRAALVDCAENYRWSSARHHLGIQPDGLITSHPCYIALGSEREKRVETYRAMLDEKISDDDRALIRSYMQQERALGNLKFQLMVEKTLNRPARVRSIGRPKNETKENTLENQILF